MKAILVIDMPNNCEECNIIYFQGHGERSTCDSGDWSKRPSWCPLKDLPSKMIPEMVMGNKFAEGCVQGWNDCLDAITGEI